MQNSLTRAASGAGQLPVDVQRDRPVQHRLGGLDLRRARGQFELGVLERRDRRPERLAVLGVVDRRGDRRPRLRHRTDRDGQPLLRQVVAEVAERLALLPQHVGRGHPHVDEGQLGGVLHLAAHLVQFAAAGEAGHAVLDDEQRQPLAPVVGIRRRAGNHDHQVGLHAAGDERLGAVDDPVVAVAHRGGAHAREVRSGAGLGHRDRGEQLARRQAREPAVALLGVRVVQEVRQDHLELGAHRRQRDQRPRRLLLHHHVVAVVGLAAAAVLLGDGHAEHAQRAHLLEHLAGHPAALLPLGIVRHHFLLHEVAAQLAERLVVLGE